MPPDFEIPDFSPALPGGTRMPRSLTPKIGRDAMRDFFANSEEVLPRVISRSTPKLPATLARKAPQGTVKVEFTVDAQGRVVNPTIKSTSNPALNQPTLDAIKQWRFEPGTRGGKRVPFKMMQPFNYG
jgi:protein TonB